MNDLDDIANKKTIDELKDLTATFRFQGLQQQTQKTLDKQKMINKKQITGTDMLRAMRDGMDYQPPKLKIAVLVSGNGSNLQLLIDKQLSGELDIDIVGVISNKQNAYALTRAKNANLDTFVIDKNEQGKTYKRVEFEQKALAILNELQPDLIVLAGFMKILTPLFIDGVNDLGVPMINLHPSLLPHYKGLDTHERVLKSGEQFHGCSVHLVNSELDSGQVLTQAILAVDVHDTKESLQQRVHQLEHRLLPWTIYLIAQDLLPLDECTQTKGQMIYPLPWRMMI